MLTALISRAHFPSKIRPSFRLLEKWLQMISTHWRISRSLNIPNELLNEISTFSGFHRKILEECSD